MGKWETLGGQCGGQGGLGNGKWDSGGVREMGKWETVGRDSGVGAADNVPFHYLPLSLTLHTSPLSPSSLALPLNCPFAFLHCTMYWTEVDFTALHS